MSRTDHTGTVSHTCADTIYTKLTRGAAGRADQCSTFTGIGPEAESNHVTLRIKYGICPAISGIYPNPAAESNLGYIPLFWQATVAASRQGREFIMPPRRTGFNEYMPQGQRTLTEVDGVVEIGPVGPATQKEVAPAQANNSRKRDAAEAAAQPAAARRAARGHATAARDRNDRQPAATAAPQDGSSGQLEQVANTNTTGAAQGP